MGNGGNCTNTETPVDTSPPTTQPQPMRTPMPISMPPVTPQPLSPPPSAQNVTLSKHNSNMSHQGHSQPDDQPSESQTRMSVTNVCHTESESEENTCYEAVAEPLFTWGPHDGHAFGSIITSVYNEVVHWRPNLFLVPFEKVGNSLCAKWLDYSEPSLNAQLSNLLP